MTDLSQPTRLPDFSGLDLDFDIIDAHHHFFALDQLYYPWLTDEPNGNFLLGNYDAIRKDYLPQDYLRDQGDLRVIKTVHVEAEIDRDNPVSESSWLSRLNQETGKPDAIVAHAWFHEPDCREVLSEQARFPLVRGIRSKPVTSARWSERDSIMGQPASMQDPAWRKGLGLLREFNLSWDLRVPFWHLREAAEVCRLYPDLPVVVEHTGLAWDRSEAGLGEWRQGMQALAQQEQVFLKISELGLAGDPWDYHDNEKLVREAIEIFGFDRCMFASNFPVSGLRIGYQDQVKAIAHMIRDASRHERDRLFRGTAATFYRL